MYNVYPFTGFKLDWTSTAGDVANAGYDAAIAGINRGNQDAQANSGNLEDQLLDAAGDVLDNIIDLGEKAKVLKRVIQAINN